MTVTINADMGESLGIHSFGNDDALLAFVDMINVACGMHAGDPSGMARTVNAALEAGVSVGAHPGLPDIVGFGRREMDLTPDEVRDLIRYQVGALNSFLEAAGAPLHHIKPHGALYGMLSRRNDLMEAACDVAEQYGVPVLGLPNTSHQWVSDRRGVEFISEFYVDLDYRDDATVIVSRSGKHRDLDEVERKARRALDEGTTLSVNGAELSVVADCLCVLSDMPNAPEVAQRVRALVDEFNRANAVP